MSVIIINTCSKVVLGIASANLDVFHDISSRHIPRREEHRDMSWRTFFTTYPPVTTYQITKCSSRHIECSSRHIFTTYQMCFTTVLHDCASRHHVLHDISNLNRHYHDISPVLHDISKPCGQETSGDMSWRTKYMSWRTYVVTNMSWRYVVTTLGICRDG